MSLPTIAAKSVAVEVAVAIASVVAAAIVPSVIFIAAIRIGSSIVGTVVIGSSVILAAVVRVRVIGAGISVIPRACADEDPVHEIAGAVVSVGRTGIRIFRVIAVRAGWRSGDIARTESDADAKSDFRL